MQRVTVHLVSGDSFSTSVPPHEAARVRESLSRLPRTGLLNFDGDWPKVVIPLDMITMLEFGEDE